MYQFISKTLGLVLLQAYMVTTLHQVTIVNRSIVPDQNVICFVADQPITLSTSLGQLGIVTKNHVPITSVRERKSKIIALCFKGQTLAINGIRALNYRVVMSDGQEGYIARRFVRLMPFEAQAEKQNRLSGAVLGRRLVNTALKFQNKVFRPRVGNLKDCDFVQFVYSKCGIQLPPKLMTQAARGYSVPTNHPEQWHPGDRLYFALYSDKLIV